jgi:U3 small nucleolar RNA-associated protein 10
MKNSDEEHTSPPPSLLKRRAQALITFVGSAATPAKEELQAASELGGGSMKDLVSLLIHVVTLQGGAVAKNIVEDVSEAARFSLHRTLSAIHATKFVDGALAVLETGEDTVSHRAFDFLLWF